MIYPKPPHHCESEHTLADNEMDTHHDLSVVRVVLVAMATDDETTPHVFVHDEQGIVLPGCDLGTGDDPQAVAFALAQTLLGRTGQIGPIVHQYEMPTWDVIGERPVASGIAVVVRIDIASQSMPSSGYHWMPLFEAILRLRRNEDVETLIAVQRADVRA
jgi:hypothetical protein